jgi:hypothetical protein
MGRFLGVGMIVALLAGCGGAQTSAVPQGAIAQSLIHKGASERQLLYLGEWKWVSSRRVGQTLILSYPSGHKVATINNFGPMCTDSSGDVYVQTASTLTEYAPGGTSPIAQATLSGGWGLGCAVDTTTGDIAACGGESINTNPYSIGWVAIYPNLNQTPTVLTNDHQVWYDFCGYDDAGNLFLDGFCDCSGGFSELPEGATQFIDFPNTVEFEGPVQWDGKYITVEYPTRGGSGGQLIWRVTVSGSSVSIVGTTWIRAFGGDEEQYTWIEGSTVVKPYGKSQKNDEVGYWPYPKGGSKPSKVLKGFEYVEYPLISTSYSN